MFRYDMEAIKRFIKNDLYIMILDIIMFCGSYYLSLFLRFSFNGIVDPQINEYVTTVIRFAPFYSVISIFIYYAFKLYGGIWRYSGASDLNRVIFANICCAVVYIAGTVLFIQRMPITFYAMGAIIQFFLTLVTRFGYRLLLLGRRQLKKKGAPAAVVVGAQENGKELVRMLYSGMTYKPVGIISVDQSNVGLMIEGVLVYQTDEFETVIKNNDVKAVFVSDNRGDSQAILDIKEYCSKNNIQFHDYTAFLEFDDGIDSFATKNNRLNDDSDTDRKRTIPFSPPDISDLEISEVVDALKSGWITTGPRVKLLERRLAAYIETGENNYYTERELPRWSNRVVCLNSATAAEELNLRILGVRPGDEVIVPAYTYTSTASAAIHCGATVKFVDIQKDGDSFTHMPEIDYEKLEQAITEKTKAIVPVDLGGIVCDYDRIFEIVEKKKSLFKPLDDHSNPLSDLGSRIQQGMGRVAVVSDCAHSLGASRVVSHTGKGILTNPEKRYCGNIADFSSFSFHAVKNFTTAEGGASTWCLPEAVYERYGVSNEEIYKMYQLMSLHGQSKDALAKTKIGAWEYDIVGPWYKCNMTDITAAIGLRQLDRYESLLARRKEMLKRYDAVCDELGISHLYHHVSGMDSSNHLYMIRLTGNDADKRNILIEKMAEHGIATNVHYKPLPMMSAYKNLGWDIKDFPNAYAYYQNLVTLPFHTLLTDGDVGYVCNTLRETITEIRESKK